ncbi:unnamed protein product [Dimorphilus gyrociliatus]|uniref:SH2 domain-containing protein n=1 Tax=Dimorphilus gyrociliatus TaxID=2664684 RepID=A0A7I8VBM7_9ANNE|nr:unnamed protein product [Dimorphilus gyrociliatus]
MTHTIRTSLVEDVRRLPYFHADLDNKAAKKILCDFIKEDGCFLLRPSSSENHACTFSVTNQGSILHVKLFKTNSSQYHLDVDQTPFPSIQRLVAHYSNSAIPCENYTNMKFIFPITSKKQTKLQRISECSIDTATVSRPLPAPPLENLDKKEEVIKEEVCECGLQKSNLAAGWTVHVSHEPATRGLLFFQHKDGLKVWELPIDIVSLLTSEQRNFLQANGYRGALT